jgi:DnaJ-class molecular chaperone
MAENNKGEVVTCLGCNGAGYWRPPMGREHTCKPCQGLGQVRLKEGEVWCGRCSGTGEIESGIPGAVSFRGCQTCGGRGRKRI